MSLFKCIIDDKELLTLVGFAPLIQVFIGGKSYSSISYNVSTPLMLSTSHPVLNYRESFHKVLHYLAASLNKSIVIKIYTLV